MANPTNPEESGSDSADTPLTLDQAANLDFKEVPETNSEEQEPAVEQEPADTPEGEETEDEPETEETDAETPEEEEAAEVDPDDALVALGDGSKVPIKELRNGYMREKDYRHKTQELGNKSRAVEATNSRVQGTVDALVDYLAKHIPDAPDASLALSNPSEHYQKKVLHESAMAQLNELIGIGGQAKDVGQTISAEQRQEQLASENAKLLERLPYLADSKKREDFNRKTIEAVKSVGFSQEEINRTFDHRQILLGHYARLGMEAEQARKKAAQKGQNVPPVTPNAQRGARPGDKSRKNQEAMARLRKTGSINDAMKIDFD